MEVIDIDEELNGTLCRLSVYSPFAFNLLVGMERHPSKQLETMGVTVKAGRISLAYNPDFVATLSSAECSYVLVHEMLHVLLHHCTHRSSNDAKRHYRENVAMDLAVNSMIPEDSYVKMPRFKENTENHKAGEPSLLLPSQFEFPAKLSFEQYLDLLEKKFPDSAISFQDGSTGDGDGDGNPQDGDGDGKSSNGNMNGKLGGKGKCKGNGNSDDDGMTNPKKIDPNCPLGKITADRISSDHGDGYDEDPYIDDMIRNAVEQIERNHQWGSMSGDSIEQVKKAQEQPMKWGDLLRLNAGSFITFTKTPTRRRWNKHYGKPFLGETYRSTEPVAVYADTSGSVGSDDLSRFIVEIERISYYTGVYFWCFDTCVMDPDKITMFCRQAINSIEFKGRGGTSFMPIFEHAKEHNIKKIVVLTDGYAESIDESSVEGMDIIWCITKGGSVEGKPGRVIEMK